MSLKMKSCFNKHWSGMCSTQGCRDGRREIRAIMTVCKAQCLYNLPAALSPFFQEEIEVLRNR